MSGYNLPPFVAYLNVLRDKIRLNGKPFTPAQVEAGTTAAGHPVAASYFRQLLNGHAQNPSRSVMDALAKFFGVDGGYFFDSDPENVAPYLTHKPNLIMIATKLGQGDEAELEQAVQNITAGIKAVRKRKQAENG